MKISRNFFLKIGYRLAWSGAMASFILPCCGQGTFQVTFDGPPVQPVGTAYTLQNYYEYGISFTPIDPNASFSGFTRTKGGGQLAGSVPDNGTAYLSAAASDSLKFRLLNGSLFGLSSVELAGYSTGVPDFNLHFVGYRPDGSTVAADFSGSGINFQTFYFGSEFTGLSRVEISTIGWSLDNLVVSIPEPSSGAMVFFAGLLFAAVRFARRFPKIDQ